MILTVQERDSIMNGLNQDQQDFLRNELSRSRRTSFANSMAKGKGFHIPEDTDPEEIEILLDDWVYTHYIDAGVVSPLFKCECGRPLRYQHIVEHKGTGEVKKFGIEHLKEHLGIDAAIVTMIIKGFDAIDYELDELLVKIKNGWQVDPDLLSVEELPADIKVHLSLNLPLLDKQAQKLRRLQTSQRASAIPSFNDSLSRNYQTIEQPILTSWDIPRNWKQPIDEYLNKGIRSARIICDLLIREHGAPNERYSSGKPVCYFFVCRYMERNYPGAKIEEKGQEDRLYTLK